MSGALIDTRALERCLLEIGLDEWPRVILALIGERLSTKAHGDFQEWTEALDALGAEQADPDTTRRELLRLAPWRKGPFTVNGVQIDSEWRSDLKWQRVKDRIAPLAGRAVLDVGCGNGFYSLEMRKAGARTVIGVDPTLLFVMQFLAVNRFAADDQTFVLPLRLDELPLPARRFDTSFSMGVLYHQRAPIDHLRQLRQTLRPGGQLVLETIYLPGDGAFARTPENRYARMRNVWHLPSLEELGTWMSRSGFTDIEVVDRSVTTVEEQRSTDWMPFESLQEALDPNDPMLTVEGWPAPHRAVVTATAK